MNEEEIRGKLLLPYLTDLGFNPSEISLEKTFTIRLGKYKRKVTGRADILCKRNGKNLFILELKNDEIAITAEDIAQGISYARLLPDNIAPFTIISNGKTTQVFDTISGDELTGTQISKQSSYYDSNYTLTTDVDLRMRLEALKNFIGFSRENLVSFCEDQVRDRMGPVLGSVHQLQAKFVKELTVQRPSLQQAFDTFLQSDNRVFGIIGGAGVGKTTAVCALALHELEKQFVFFYNATIISKSPLELIAQDLNGVFSSKSESDNILKKLDEFGRFLNTNVLIVLDAIDESIDPLLGHELSEIALAVRNLERVKLCISCKTNIWKQLLIKKETPTHLFEELSKTHSTLPQVDNLPGFLLTDFTPEELRAAIPLYQQAFGFQGTFSDELLQNLRNGFFLRIFSEVYSGREVPEDINDKELIKEYLVRSLKRTTLGSELGFRILARLGEVLITHAYKPAERYRDQGLSVNDLTKKLNLASGETLPEELFTQNILIRSNREDLHTVYFYYSKIRDYIICYHSYQLDKLTDSEFYAVLPKFYENYIGDSAMDLYLENISPSHAETLMRFKQDKALTYVNQYNDFLEQHFKKIKEKFDPGTTGDIGIYLPKDLIHEDGYALFSLPAPATSKVKFKKLKEPFINNLFLEDGVTVVYGSHQSLLVADQTRTIRQNIFQDLREILKRGRLNTHTSDILMREQLALIRYFYSKELGYTKDKLKDYYLPRFSQIYPIDLIDLRKRLYEFCIKAYYRYSELDPQEVSNRIADAIEKNTPMPKLNIRGDFPPFEELLLMVDILLGKGYQEITEHHLPLPDISISDAQAVADREKKREIRHLRTLQFSRTQAEQYVTAFLTYFDTCYKEFVEDCFPTLKDQFEFYTTMPHEYFVYMKDGDVLKWGQFGYRKAESGKVSVNFKQAAYDDEPFENGETDRLIGFILDHMLYNDYTRIIPTIDTINTPKVNEFCVIRNWIYKFLTRDIKPILDDKRKLIAIAKC